MKQEWQVIDSTSNIMRDFKKILYRAESLTEAIDWRQNNGYGSADNIKIRTKPEARAKKEEYTGEVPSS